MYEAEHYKICHFSALKIGESHWIFSWKIALDFVTLRLEKSRFVKKNIPIVTVDSWLQPYQSQLEKRRRRCVLKELELADGQQHLADCCNNHLYYGLHATENGWIFREKAPSARRVFIYGDFSYWKVEERFALRPIGNGDWEIELPREFLRHGMLYKLWMVWQSGADERLPSYVRRVVQDDTTKIFAAQVWCPEQPYQWQSSAPARPTHPLVYEAHIGMATEAGRVGTYKEFEAQVLPRIKSLGYNTLQLMAIQEHPYYGSFGYQVSNFYAPSSRFGTPEELKSLIDSAHSLNIRVILDVVHSHSVLNEREGLSCFDGSSDLYFHSGERGTHPVWNSRCFNYAKNDTLMFLLSNLKYWLEEFHFDGFRFDGVTSMCYRDHGIGVDFLEYSQYFDANVDEDAITYLYLANRVTHQVNSEAITVAEDVSGMPALAHPTEQGCIGFDYRMSMGVADFWTKTVKEVPDEQWHVGDIFYRLTDHRKEEKVISYVESHDQAMVGDQTLIFRLIGAKMYDKMSLFTPDLEVDRGVALHKMITFCTAALCDDGFLNFMGNEFGHPEWIDFPREGNNWSYHYARRQWSLVDDKSLKFSCLNNFNRDLLTALTSSDILSSPAVPLVRDIANQMLAFSRGTAVFIFNFNPEKSFTDFPIYCKSGKYKIALSTDNPHYGGFGHIDETTEYFSRDGVLQVYLPARTAVQFIITD